MNTPSHFLMTAVITRVPRLKIVRSAALLGSVAPDIPLYLLSFGTFAWLRYVDGWEPGRIFRTMFSEFFYENPWWIFFHNFLHAPLVLLSGIAIVYFRNQNWQQVQKSWWFWFYVSCLFHSIVDILTHNDDGPLTFFPLNWRTRFSSPISYWDSDHFGREFSTFELLLDLAIIVFLMVGWISNRRKKAFKWPR